MAIQTPQGEVPTTPAAPPANAGDPLRITRVVGFGDAGLDAEWTKYCGHLDLSMDKFLEIQKRLLREQIELIGNSSIGRRMFKGRIPADVDEFRANVPLTTYGDYVSLLGEQDDAVLDGVPHIWAHTTGAQAGYKYVPYTTKGIERLLDSLMSSFILAAANRKGEVNVRPGDTVLYNTPERPYVSGLATFGMRERFGFGTVLTPEESEHLDFKERIRAGFRAALGKRVDVIISMTSVLNKVGQGFSDQSRRTTLDRSLLKPRALARLLRALVKRKILRRAVLPRDLWPTKAIIGWGIDTSFFRDQVERYWGRAPFEIYACTEGGVMASETWERNGLVFNPYSDFIEFIPLDEHGHPEGDDSAAPTALLNEVEPDKAYEVVISNFYGMAFVRYRVGHFVRFLPRADWHDELPTFTFEGRADDRIDLAGFTRLDAKTIWEAMAEAGLAYRDWTARKEFEGDAPILHVYIELDEPSDERELTRRLDQAIRAIDPFYGDLESMLDILPLQVSVLKKGTFDRFYDSRREAGYPLERRTPPKMNASDQDIADLKKADQEPG